MSLQIDIVMPFLAETMEEGTVIQWLKAPGDNVAVGDDLVEIETDKVIVVYKSDTGGVVVELLVAPEETVACGSVIARIATS